MSIRFLILFILSCNASAFGYTDSTFYDSNQLFKEARYSEAIDSYKSILGQKISHATLYYNIGNCYYRMDSLAQAILFYEKAYLHAPNDNDIKYNITIANQKLIDDIKAVPDFIFVNWFKSFNSLLSESQWAGLLLFLLYLTFVILVIFLFSNQLSIKLTLIKVCLFIVPLFFISLVFLLYSSSDRRFSYGVLLNSNAYVKSSPSESSSDYFIIHEGVKFEIIDQLNDWCRIELADGKDGWILNDTFKKINLEEH